MNLDAAAQSDFDINVIDRQVRERNQNYSYLTNKKEKDITFQICQSCFWCASSLNQIRVFDKCLACQADRINSIPVVLDESYSYGYNNNNNRGNHSFIYNDGI